MKHITAISVFAIMVWIGAAARAEADPLSLSPAQVLDVHFVLPDAPFPFGTPNTLVFTIDITRIAPFGSFSASLFDNGQRLGTFSSSLNGDTSSGGLGLDAFFVSKTSPWDPPGDEIAAIVDFSSLADRSIDGLLRLSIAQGLVDVRPESAHFVLGLATPSQNLFGSTSTNPVVTNVEIRPVPEPGTLWLVGASSAILIRRKGLFARSTGKTHLGS